MRKLGFKTNLSKNTKPITNSAYKFKEISKKNGKFPIVLPDISVIAMAVSKKQEADRKKKKRTPNLIRIISENKKAKSPQSHQKIKQINLTNTKTKTGIVRRPIISIIKGIQNKSLDTKINSEKMKKEKDAKTKEKQSALTNSHFNNFVKTTAYKSGKDKTTPINTAVIEKIHNTTKKISNALTPKKARVKAKTPPLRIRVDYQNSMS